MKLRKKGQEIAAALDELAEEDTVGFTLFFQARFNVFFKEDVKAEMKPMMSVQQWQGAYVRTECVAAVRSYLVWKRIFGEANVEFVTLDQSQLQVLSGFQCSEEDRPKLRDEAHEKMTAWLSALPGSVRKNVEEKILVATWKKEHFFGTLVEFFESKKKALANFANVAPTTPPMALAKFADVASPEKRTRTKADFPEYTGLSPAKCRMVEAENLDSKFTPLDKVGSTYKIRHNVLGKVLMVGKVQQLKFGVNKDRTLEKFSYILGSKTGTMEISAIGQIVQRCYDQVIALKGQVVSLSNTVFEKNMAHSAMV